MIIDETTLINVAIEAAKSAASHVMANLSRRHETLSVGAHDIKHVLDVEAQQVAEHVIATHYPNHAILAEEGDRHTLLTHGYQWIIDPIDGTVNFYHGLPYWCTSVAVFYDGQAVAGCVYAPVLNKCFTATASGSAYCNGEIIHVSQAHDLSLALFSTGADRNRNAPEASFRYLNKIAEVVQRPRILGSAAIDLCHVAEGLTDGYFETGIYIWDVAAAGLIVTRAGGRCEILHQHAQGHFAYLATGPGLFERSRTLLTSL